MAERPISTITGDTPYAVANFPLPSTSEEDIRGPRAHYMVSSSLPFSSESPRDSYSNANATPYGSGTLLANKNEGYAEDSILRTTTTTPPPKLKRRTVILILLLLLAFAMLIVAVVVPVYFTVIKPKLDASKNLSGGGGGSPKSGGSGGSTPSPGSSNIVTGGDGSTIHAADGSTFTYRNPFGGFCKCFTVFDFLFNGNC